MKIQQPKIPASSITLTEKKKIIKRSEAKIFWKVLVQKFLELFIQQIVREKCDKNEWNFTAKQVKEREQIGSSCNREAVGKFFLKKYLSICPWGIDNRVMAKRKFCFDEILHRTMVMTRHKNCQRTFQWECRRIVPRRRIIVNYYTIYLVFRSNNGIFFSTVLMICVHISLSCDVKSDGVEAKNFFLYDD